MFRSAIEYTKVASRFEVINVTEPYSWGNKMFGSSTKIRGLNKMVGCNVTNSSTGGVEALVYDIVFIDPFFSLNTSSILQSASPKPDLAT